MNDDERRSSQSVFWPTIAAILGLTITVAASIWQYGRGVEKDSIAARIANANTGAEITVPTELVSANDWLYRNVRLRGEFLPETLVLHDNQIRDKRVGYIVYTVFRVAGSSMHCLVKRGWVVASADRAVWPKVPTTFGETEISGLALPGSTKFLELSENVAGKVWQNVTVNRAAAAFGLTLQPFMIEQHSELADGLRREWSTPVSASAKHYGYAFQWAAMATLIMILYGFFYVRRKQKQP